MDKPWKAVERRTEPLILLAIDPGPEQSALVVWDGERIRQKAILPNKDLIALDYVDSGLAVVNCLVVEQVRCYGMPVGAHIFDTVEWTGRFIQWWIQFGKPLFQTNKFVLMPRMEVKMHLCHTSRAKDPNIRQALIDRYGPPGTKKNKGLLYGLKRDMWSAFALAITFMDKWEKKNAENMQTMRKTKR